MKRIAIALLLLAGPAMAADDPPAGQKACELQLNRLAGQDREDATAAFTLQAQLTTAQQQVAALTVERDALKAKVLGATAAPTPGPTASLPGQDTPAKPN